MKKHSFRSEFLANINTKNIISEATLPDYSGDDEYDIKDQIKLIKDNPDILAKMKNADKETLEYVLKKWNTFSNNDKQAILHSEYRQKLKDILDDKKQKQEKEQQLINNWQNLSSNEKLNAFHDYGKNFMKKIASMYPTSNTNISQKKEQEPISYYNRTPVSKEKQLEILDKNPLDIIYMENPYKETISLFQTLAQNRNLGLNTIYNPIVKYYLSVDPKNIDRNNYHKFTSDEFNKAYNQITKGDFTDIPNEYSLKKLGRNEAEKLIKLDPNNILKFTDADEALKLLAVKRNPLIIEDFYNHKMPISKTLMKQAIDESLNVLKILKDKNIKLPDDIAKYCISKCPQSIVILVNPSEELKNYAISKRPTLADKLNLEDELPNIVPDYNFISNKNKEKLKAEDDKIIANLLEMDDKAEYDPNDKNFDSKKFLQNKENQDVLSRLNLIKGLANGNLNDEELSDITQAFKNESLSNYLNRMKKTLLSE